MYEHIRDYIAESDRTGGLRTNVRLVWHGGEPLLLDPGFYRETFADQRRILAGLLVSNRVTTNLTRLDDARLARPGPDLAAEIAIFINLGIVHLYQQDPEGALEQLRPAAARATAAGDASGRAHALELMGVAAWMLKNPDGAKGWWEHAEHLYAEIEEREGQARCLQHLGSAEVVAGRLDEAKNLLEHSAAWRGYESPTLAKYLAAARKIAATPEVADEGPRGRLATGWIRRLIDRWLLR